ncbi:MAG: hypothetical protein KDD76_06695, partial [Rickettsiales bacterium]|nr:hypothetical protein [Rickettsiales bacterium]
MTGHDARPPASPPSIDDETLRVASALQQSDQTVTRLSEEKSAIITQMLEQVGMTVEELQLILGVAEVTRAPEGVMVLPDAESAEMVTL